MGARLWLSILLVGWGAVATCMMFVKGVASFYVLRVLLGAFEAGAVPGIWYHLALFIPANRITSPYAYLSVAIMAANVLGAPLAAGLLSMDGLGGLKGWQWLFMLEGIPSVLLGLVLVVVLPNTPHQARWLSPAEAELVEQEVRRQAGNSTCGPWHKQQKHSQPVCRGAGDLPWCPAGPCLVSDHGNRMYTLLWSVYRCTSVAGPLLSLTPSPRCPPTQPRR